MNMIKRFAADESGATAIEYGLLAGLISVVAVAFFTSSGDALKGVFEVISGKLEEAEAKAPGS